MRASPHIPPSSFPGGWLRRSRFPTRPRQRHSNVISSPAQATHLPASGFGEKGGAGAERLRAPQCGFSRLGRRSSPRSGPAAGRRIALRGVTDRSALPDHGLDSAGRSCNQSCAKCRTRGTASVMVSPSSRRDTNRRRSSITEHSFHGIDTSPGNPGKCYLCVRYDPSPMSQVAHRTTSRPGQHR